MTEKMIKENNTTDLFAAFDEVISLVRSAWAIALKDAGFVLTPLDTKILSILKAQPGIILHDLVTSMSKDKAQITRKIKDLEEKSFITRQKTANDQRSYQLFLTPQGKQAQAKTQLIKSKVYRQIFARLNTQEQADIVRLLNKCIEENR